MTTNQKGHTTPMDILHTEPTRVPGNRRVSFEWVLQQPTDTASQVATLDVRHDGPHQRLIAFFSREWRQQRGSGFSHIIEIGAPGVDLESEPLARFSQKRLDDYAGRALESLRSSDHPNIAVILTPSDRSCGCGTQHESGCAVRMAEVTAERATKEAANWERAALRPPARRAAQPDWLFVRLNDGYGTDNEHAFWTTVTVEKIGNWKIFEKDGWRGYDTRHNVWAHFGSEAEAKVHAAGGSVDVWA